MRGRYPSPATVSYSFGPGPLSPAIKILIAVNVGAFLVTFVAPDIIRYLGLSPSDTVERARLWQPLTYMFLHGGIFHILFNMLMLWMFGVELERMWGSRYFTKFYFVAGLGAAAATIVLAYTPGIGDQFYTSLTIGASGAIYGVLLAYALYFPNRPILMFMLFPIPARYFVMIVGGISLLSSMGGAGGGVAHVAHLGGLVTGYFYLKGMRLNLSSEIQYRYLKWKMNRMRKKFDVYQGGRPSDVDRRVH